MGKVMHTCALHVVSLPLTRTQFSPLKIQRRLEEKINKLNKKQAHTAHLNQYIFGLVFCLRWRVEEWCVSVWKSLAARLLSSRNTQSDTVLF